MGASGWDYVVSYQPDLSAALNDLQDELLATGDFLWDERYWDGAPRPTTRAELEAVKESEEFWDEGTHTILDMDRVVPTLAGNLMEDTGAIRPLSAQEVQESFGTDRPTPEDFYRAYEQDPRLTDILRWTGRAVVLFGAGQERQIAFFGVSGD
jgi:hypothetical protein